MSKAIRDYLRGAGGIRAPQKGTMDKYDPRRADEYRYLPSWAKNNTSQHNSTIDQMAHQLAEVFPGRFSGDGAEPAQVAASPGTGAKYGELGLVFGEGGAVRLVLCRSASS